MSSLADLHRAVMVNWIPELGFERYDRTAAM